MSSGQRALIIGASRGLGLGIATALHQQGWAVTATRRSPSAATDNLPARWLALDINDAAQRAAFCQTLAQDSFDLVLINAGVYGPERQDLTAVDPEQLIPLFLTNTLAPIALASALLPHLAPHATLAFMTSRLGSLTENASAELPFYAASKAALNMLTRGLSDAVSDHQVTLLSLHPGWVQTDLGGSSAPLTIESSVSGLLQQITRYQGKGGHHFVDYAGNLLAW
ncbi:SDR family oxidoreductase [Dickeya solani]|uniref:SDR family oxidoreductase n=1 Tax=Dickeya solani TaxID=1089444 RepID=A0ABU4EDR2_9GAMM|nr:SDR family oxidoreductase [Dickeya solani]MCA6998981.1 SDR family oxidoreductase [Dickeya solani]MCZ0823680.1 SDR family oxidoreductase [Dickeya solani]MDV6995798.1 SDR family oxidoreductase [Dickeya solani]MDV7003769.1 SDR family oxidoreductase [Dickeya solani]MDV7040282.1 SDR family oxidoreductase [Dickeya solani]